MTARLLLWALMLSLVAVAGWGIHTAAARTVQLQQRDAAIALLSGTMREMQERHDATDRLLAETARRRDAVQRSAAQLARDLAAASASDHCPAAAISDGVAERVREYRAGTARNGASAPDLD